MFRTVESRYIEAKGTVINTLLYPSFIVSNSQNYIKPKITFEQMCACPAVIAFKISIYTEILRST